MGLLGLLGLEKTEDGDKEELYTCDELPQKEPVIVSKEFTMKFKYSYFEYKGTESFFFVSEDETIYRVSSGIQFNIYVWKTAEVGDRIKVTFDQPNEGAYGTGNKYEFVKKKEMEYTIK